KPVKRLTETRRRQSSSPFANTPRIKPTVLRTKSLFDDVGDGSSLGGDEEDRRLTPRGKVLTTVSVDGAKAVLSAIQYAHASMFTALPERAGMNSVRIAEVLNFQRN